MIVVLKPEISRKEETAVLKEIRKLGYKPHIIRGVERTVIGAIGDERTHHTLEALSMWPQVEKVIRRLRIGSNTYADAVAFYPVEVVQAIRAELASNPRRRDCAG